MRYFVPRSFAIVLGIHLSLHCKTFRFFLLKNFDCFCVVLTKNRIFRFILVNFSRLIRAEYKHRLICNSKVFKYNETDFYEY